MKRFMRTVLCVLTCALIIVVSSSAIAENREIIPGDTTKVRYSVIKETDTMVTVAKKEKRNELVKSMEDLINENEQKMKNHESTPQSEAQYKADLKRLGEQINALGLDPTEGMTPDELYRDQVDSYISDKIMAENMYDMLCQEHSDQPEYLEKYHLATVRKEYLIQVKENYLKGKISAEDAIKSFVDQYKLFQ